MEMLRRQVNVFPLRGEMPEAPTCSFASMVCLELPQVPQGHTLAFVGYIPVCARQISCISVPRMQCFGASELTNSHMPCGQLPHCWVCIGHTPDEPNQFGKQRHVHNQLSQQLCVSLGLT